MPRIDSTIIQPLRWYDSTDKQNFRRSWVKNGLRKFNVIINPAHSIIPFQVRRPHSVSPVTILDLYNAETDLFEENILSLLPAPTNDHIKIYQSGVFDNIVFSQVSALTSNLTGGYYYLHLSDGVRNFYSEVFMVSCDYEPATVEYISEINNDYTEETLIELGGGDYIEIINLPY